MNALYQLITGTARSDDAVADVDYRRLFFGHSEKIIQLKHNDPNAASLLLILGHEAFNNRAWRRLGEILAQNTCLKRLTISGGNLDVVGLCIGLENNKHIQAITFREIDLSDPEKMHALAQFLRNNPSLEEIQLPDCKLGHASCNILSAALDARSLDTLRSLNLDRNHVGDIAVDRLIQVLRQSEKVEILSLDRNGIGQRGCASIATMLKDPQSNLQRIWLAGNHLTDESLITLAHSLADNTRLAQLSVGVNNQITFAGWTVVKDLVCNTTRVTDVVRSNHTLKFVGGKSSSMQYLGRDTAELVFASLDLNHNLNKRLVVRQKIVWGHAEGRLNIAQSSIWITALPVILAWFTDESSSNTVLLQHQEQIGLMQSIASFSPDQIFVRHDKVKTASYANSSHGWVQLEC